MKARASMKSLELEVGETEEKSKETIAPAENEGLSTDPPLESTKNEPVQPETSPETDPSKTTEQSIPSTSVEIKRRTTPEDELQQLSELLRHAVSQQFNVLRRVRKFMDTVSFLSILYCRWNRKLWAEVVNMSTNMPCLPISEVLLLKLIMNSLLILRTRQLFFRRKLKRIYLWRRRLQSI